MSPHQAAANSATARDLVWVRRGYAALVVGLAAFLGVVVVLREPVRGYLGSVRISGHLTEGQNPAELGTWLESAAVGVRAKVVASQLYPGDCEIELEHLSPRPHETAARLNELAQRFVNQYLPAERKGRQQTRLARLQAELQAARDCEDLLRTRVDELRHQQMSALAAANEYPQAAPAQPVAAAPPSPAANREAERRQSKLQQLREELAQLLTGFTDAHPQVMGLRAQIARLEAELSPPADDAHYGEGPALAPAVADQAGGPAARGASREYRDETHLVSTSLESPESAGDLATQLDGATLELAAATRNRQWSEGQLQMALDALSKSYEPTTWSVAPVQIVARIGGTPRTSTLAAAALVALIAAVLMYRATAVLAHGQRIESKEHLQASLALPLVGSVPASQCLSLGWRVGKILPFLVRATTHAAEIGIVLLLLLCLGTAMGDAALAGEFATDPLGALSEVIGRWEGR